MLTGWNHEALLDEVLHGPWDVPSPLDDTVAIDPDDWRQRLTPSLPQGGMNEVAFARMSERDADAIIDRTIAEYARAGIRSFRWGVTPGSTPADLADRLAARGFSRVEIRGMARDVSPIDVALPAGARVEHVDLATVDEFTEAMAAGWAMDAGPLIEMHRRMLRVPGERYVMFLVRQDGKPVATAAYSAAPRSAHVSRGGRLASLGFRRSRRSAYQMGAVVLPAFRGRGFYQALVAVRLAHCAARGLTLATSQARAETSAPILEKLGFVTVCRFPSFTSPVR